jgi:hypothetical protein
MDYFLCSGMIGPLCEARFRSSGLPQLIPVVMSDRISLFIHSLSDSQLLVADWTAVHCIVQDSSGRGRSVASTQIVLQGRFLGITACVEESIPYQALRNATGGVSGESGVPAIGTAAISERAMSSITLAFQISPCLPRLAVLQSHISDLYNPRATIDGRSTLPCLLCFIDPICLRHYLQCEPMMHREASSEPLMAAKCRYHGGREWSANSVRRVQVPGRHQLPSAAMTYLHGVIGGVWAGAAQPWGDAFQRRDLGNPRGPSIGAHTHAAVRRLHTIPGDRVGTASIPSRRCTAPRSGSKGAVFGGGGWGCGHGLPSSSTVWGDPCPELLGQRPPGDQKGCGANHYI